MVVDRHALDGQGRTDRDALDLAPAEEHHRHPARLVDDGALETRAAPERLDPHRLDPAVHLHPLAAAHVADRRGAGRPDDRDRIGEGLGRAPGLAIGASIAVGAAIAARVR